jgi:hypothetical protein
MRFLKADSDLPWCCIGDFNKVLRQEEQMGPNERRFFFEMGKLHHLHRKDAYTSLY